MAMFYCGCCCSWFGDWCLNDDGECCCCSNLSCPEFRMPLVVALLHDIVWTCCLLCHAVYVLCLFCLVWWWWTLNDECILLLFKPSSVQISHDSCFALFIGWCCMMKFLPCCCDCLLDFCFMMMITWWWWANALLFKPDHCPEKSFELCLSCLVVVG